MPTRFVPSVVVLGVLLPALVCAQTTETKFNNSEWPSLFECLRFSDDTGAWGWDRSINSVKTEDGQGELRMQPLKIVFTVSGRQLRFALGWDESERVQNKFWRTKPVGEPAMMKLSGRWTLAYRVATAQERMALGIDSNAALKAWFLDLHFMENKLPESYAKYPALRDVVVNGRISLVLNEFVPYKRTAKAKPVMTAPNQLLWGVLVNDLGGWIMPSTVATNGLLIMRHR